MNPFLSVEGIIVGIEAMQASVNTASGCTLMISVRTGQQGITNLVVDASTYVLDQITLRVGDRITGFYDSMAPVPLIFPPQFRAIVIVRSNGRSQAVLDYFDRQLVSSDGRLRLNPAGTTQITLQNGQTFLGNITERYLLVLYTFSTRSIPAITTPDRIIVMCSRTES